MSTAVKRTKSGCITCRIRRVKCDEAKPYCGRCTSTGRRCDGYSSLPFSRRDLRAATASQLDGESGYQSIVGRSNVLPRLVSDPSFSDVLDRRYFQFFRKKTVSSTNKLLDSRFWDRIVLQACHNEPAVRHAILALSSLHQVQQDKDNAEQHLAYADRQHQKALVEAQRLISQSRASDVDRVLIACVVFICFENLRGNYASGFIHMNSGRAICSQHHQRLASLRRGETAEIEQLFARLDLSAITFSNAASPYPYTLDDFYRTNPHLLPDKFDDFAQARASLIDLLRWHMIVDAFVINTYHPPGETYLQSSETSDPTSKDILGRLDMWERSFEQLLHDTHQALDSPSVLTLRLWHVTAKLNLATDFYKHHQRYDHCLDHFERIIEIGEQLVEQLSKSGPDSYFSADLGYAPPLYVTATRCRDPFLRRRAIAVLMRYPHVEIMWETLPAGAIAERLMEVEEEGLDVKTAADVPEHRRIDDMDIGVDPPRSTAWMTIRLKSADGVPLEPRHEVVVWETGDHYSAALSSSGSPSDFSSSRSTTVS